MRDLSHICGHDRNWSRHLQARYVSDATIVSGKWSRPDNQLCLGDPIVGVLSRCLTIAFFEYDARQCVKCVLDVVKAAIGGYSLSTDAVDVVVALAFGADSVLSGGIN